MDDMTHDRCSELLHDYVGGGLDRDLAAEVSSHLAGCEDCRAEERTLTALLASEPPLDELERARLHRALTQELFADPANADVAGGPGSPSWRRWIAPAAGSAAAVLVALLVVTGGLMGGGEDSADSGSTAVQPAQGLNDEGAAEAEGGGGDLESAASEPLRAQDGAAQGAGAGKPGEFVYDADGPQPEFELTDALSSEELSEIGRTSDLFRSFSRRYTVADVPALSDRFLNRLVESSGAAERQARRCAKTLPEGQEALPAYGATGRYEGRKALVLGFVADGGGSPRLDRYLMWVWAKGSCKQPIATLFSNVER